MAVHKYPDAFKWQCGRCSTWNNIDKGLCTLCKSPVDEVACAFRLRNQLTTEEENFYKGTAPLVLQELRKITKLLSSIAGNPELEPPIGGAKSNE